LSKTTSEVDGKLDDDVVDFENEVDNVADGEVETFSKASKPGDSRYGEEILVNFFFVQKLG
jgi:hypothetical protein